MHQFGSQGQHQKVLNVNFPLNIVGVKELCLTGSHKQHRKLYSFKLLNFN